MFAQDETSPNATVILLAAGGAALAALLVVLARRGQEDEKSSADSAESAAKDGAKTVETQARKTGEDVAATAEGLREAVKDADDDARTAERDLKAAAWDAQQQAREAESRLRAAGHRVVDDASSLASRVGTEAKNLAEEGRERIAQLRHQETPAADLEREIERLRAELEELKSGQDSGERRLKVVGPGAALPWGRKSRSMDAVASEAAAAAVAQIEKSLRAKAPELIAAKNKAQLMEILQRELGPTLRDSAVQATAAAFAALEAAREGAGRDAKRQAEDARRRIDDLSDAARHLAGKVQETARDKSDSAREAVAPALANGTERVEITGEAIREAVSEQRKAAEEAVSEHEATEERRGKSGLFWGAATAGLAAYALLDPERRDKILKFANEASVQVQDLVRDLQGYDDEF